MDLSKQHQDNLSIQNQNKPHPKQNKPSDEDQEQKQCRICFGDDTLFDKFIYPCICNGSVKYIHESCLKTYIMTKNPNQQNSLQKSSKSVQKCDICKKEFQVKWKRTYKVISCNKLYKTKKCPLLILFIALAILAATFYVYFKVKSDIEDDKDALYKNAILILITVLCALSLLCILTCGTYTTLKTFFERTTSISQIKPLNSSKANKKEVVPEQLV